MPTKDIRPLKVRDNASVLDAIRRDASLEYQRRIPTVTDAGIQKTIEHIMEFSGLRNEFLDALVNRIGRVIVRNTSWTNPLAVFKKGLLEYGNTIEEVQIGLVQAKVYEHDREHMEKDIFGTHIPEIKTSFHTVNRENYYPISINDDQLRRAFLAEDGLTSFVANLLEAPATSDQWDEFQLMCSLFSRYDSQDGFYKVNIPDMSGMNNIDAADARLALRKMRAVAGEMPFISTRFNAAGMPVAAKPEELVLFVTPQMQANVDVEALAAAFNIDRANMPARTVIIPRDRFGIDGAQAILTTEDFFMVVDQVLDTTSQYNPVMLQTNYFLHHWELISASRFVPAVMFTSKEGTESITVAPLDVASVTPTVVTDRDDKPVTSVTRGEMYNLKATVKDAAGVEVNSGVMYGLVGNLSSLTYVRNDVLHVGVDEKSDSIKVVARTTYINPMDTDAAPKTSEAPLTVTGDRYDGWNVEDAEGPAGRVAAPEDGPAAEAKTAK